MYSILGMKNPIAVSNTWSLRFAKRVLDHRLKTAIRYYRQNPTYVKSEHILFRIISHLGLNLKLEDQFLENIILSKAFKAGNSQGFASYQNIGKVQRNNFYGINTDEIILMKECYHSLDSVKAIWKSATPVKILRHPQTHFGYGLLTPKNYVMNKGLAIIEIDINLLHMMHVAWYREQTRLKRQGLIDTIPNVGFFLGQYVLPNTLLSHINQVIINRNILLTDLAMPESEDYNPIPTNIPRNYNWFDKDTQAIFNRAQSGNWSIANIANNITGVAGEKALSFMDTPQMLYNRQNKWAYMLSFTHFVRHALTTPERPDRANQTNYLRPLQRELGYMMNRKVFEHPAWSDITFPYLDEIEYILNQ